MRKILISLLTLSAVAIIAIVATRAYFSDTEVSSENTITTGTIDIDVDDNNPWTEPVTIEDMKPSYVRWTRHIVRNVGDNPLKLWKHIKNVHTDENEVNEPEQDWYTTHQVGSKNDIDRYIVYDIYLGGEVSGNEDENWLGGQHSGGQVVISEEAGITIADIESVYVFLGELDPEEKLIVWQSYHMKDETENWAQTDTMTFDIEFFAQQLNGTNPPSAVHGGEGPQALLLENKEYATDWDPIIDGTWGVLRWAGDGPTFDFSTTFEGHGLAANTAYSLIYYADPWAGNHPGALLGTGTSNAAGDLNIAGNPDLGMDLPHPSDANYPDGAKIWLIPSSDYNAGTNSLIAWNPIQYLFEYNLILYNDTDI